MGSKLSFKGESKKKKKKAKTVSQSEQRQQEEEEAADGWQSVPSAALALGPIYITLPLTSITPPVCIALQPTTGKIYPFALPIPSSTDAAALASTSALELDAEDLEAVVESEVGSSGPMDIYHVWVCTRVQDSENKITLRSGSGKFLASDEMGIVTADREARGMQEEWTIEDAIAGGGGSIIRSAYNKILSVDMVAGGKMELRADGEEEDETSKFRVWMQGEYVNKARKAIAEKTGSKTATTSHEGLVIVGDLAGAENNYIQKYQARGQGRLVASAEDIKGLKRARAAGNLGEEMLERRVKLKSDRYC